MKVMIRMACTVYLFFNNVIFSVHEFMQKFFFLYEFMQIHMGIHDGIFQEFHAQIYVRKIGHVLNGLHCTLCFTKLKTMDD